MKTIFYVLFSLVIISCASNETTQESETPSTEQQQTKTIKDLSADEFKKEMTKNPGQLVDVRTPEEFASGNIEGALNINFYDADFNEQLNQLDKTKPVYIYCKSGGRSGQAKSILEDKGFTQVYNLIGGYKGWKN